MSIRDAIAQAKIRYNLELDTLEYIGDFSLPIPIDFDNLNTEDILYLKSIYNPDMIDRIIKDSKQPK